MQAQPTDHDNITTLLNEVRHIAEDIKELKTGTIDTLRDHETRIAGLQESEQKTNQRLKDNMTYFKFITGLGVLIFALLLWHLTGFKL